MTFHESKLPGVFGNQRPAEMNGLFSVADEDTQVTAKGAVSTHAANAF